MIESLASQVLGRPVPYRAYVPPGHGAGEGRYPLLLLLHGSGGNERSWDPGLEVLDASIRDGSLPPMVAVAPSSGTSWWVDGADAVETMVTSELLPHVEARFRTIPHREGRAVAGFSMGGYGAVRYALVHADRFGAAAALSASIYDDAPPSASSARTSGAFGTPFDPDRWRCRNYPAALAQHRVDAPPVPIYLVAGDDDWNEPEGWTFNCEFQSVLLFERLRKEAGRPAALRIVSGGHDWAAWRPMFADGLRYLARHLHRG